VSQFQDMQILDTRIKFYEGIGPNTNDICYGGCLAAIREVWAQLDARRPGSLKNAKPGAMVTGIYEGDVDAGGGVCLLIGDCTEVKGTIRNASKIKKVKGCPIGAVKLTGVLPFLYGMPSPMLDTRDVPLINRQQQAKSSRIRLNTGHSDLIRLSAYRQKPVCSSQWIF
jgi:hypothetical protein